MQIPTIEVFWPQEFGDSLVRINESDFNPAYHRKPGESALSAIPTDFPGALSLKEAGITALSGLVGKSESDLTAIKGIGAATAKQIVAKLKALQFTDE